MCGNDDDDNKAKSIDDRSNNIDSDHDYDIIVYQ